MLDIHPIVVSYKERLRSYGVPVSDPDCDHTVRLAMQLAMGTEDSRLYTKAYEHLKRALDQQQAMDEVSGLVEVLRALVTQQFGVDIDLNVWNLGFTLDRHNQLFLHKEQKITPAQSVHEIARRSVIEQLNRGDYISERILNAYNISHGDYNAPWTTPST